MSVMSRAEQRLTPDMVQSVAFRTARLGRRGYDEEHVREFCGRVEAELVVLLNERAALREEVGRLRRRVLGTAGEETGAGYRDYVHMQAVDILSRAQQTANTYVAEAQEYIRHLAQDARRRRQEILASARSHADLVLEQAHGEATQAARDALAAPPGQPGRDLRATEAELAYLRTFGDVYRAHLRGYVDIMVRNAGEWGQAEKSAPSGGQASTG